MSSAAIRTLQTGVRTDHASRWVEKSKDVFIGGNVLQHVKYAKVAV